MDSLCLPPVIFLGVAARLRWLSLRRAEQDTRSQEKSTRYKFGTGDGATFFFNCLLSTQIGLTVQGTRRETLLALSSSLVLGVALSQEEASVERHPYRLSLDWAAPGSENCKETNHTRSSEH